MNNKEIDYISNYFSNCKCALVAKYSALNVINNRFHPFKNTYEVFNYIIQNKDDYVKMFVQRHSHIFKLNIDIDSQEEFEPSFYDNITKIIQNIITTYYDINNINDSEYLNYMLKYDQYDPFKYVFSKKIMDKDNKYPNRFHIFYPFLIVNTVQYEFILKELRNELKKCYNKPWNKIIDNHMCENGFRLLFCNKYDTKTNSFKQPLTDKYYISYENKPNELKISDNDYYHQLFITSTYSNLENANLTEKLDFDYVSNYGDSERLNKRLNKEPYYDNYRNIIKHHKDIQHKINDKQTANDKQIENDNQANNQQVDNIKPKQLKLNQIITNNNDVKIIDNSEEFIFISNAPFENVMKQYISYDLDFYVKLLDLIPNEVISDYDNYRDIVWSVYSLTYLFTGDNNKNRIITIIKNRMSKEAKYNENDLDKLLDKYVEGRITIKKVFDYAKQYNEDKLNQLIANYDELIDDYEDKNVKVEIQKIDLPYQHFSDSIFKKYVNRNDYIGAINYYSKYYYHVINNIDGYDIYCYQYHGQNRFDINPIKKFCYENVKFKKQINDKVVQFTFKELLDDNIEKYNVIDDAKLPLLFIKKSFKNDRLIRIDRYLNTNNISKAMSLNKIINSKYESIDLDKTQEGFNFIVNDYIRNTLCLSKKRINNKLVIDEDMTNKKFNYLMDWVKGIFTVNRRETTIILGSATQGTGKSTFGELLKHILQHLLYVKDQNGKNLFSDFNGMIENKLLCNIEEFTNNRDDIRSAFKDYITGKDLSINEKNEKFRMKPSYISFLITTNDVRSLNIFEKNDRRNNYFEILPVRVGDIDFFDKLYYYIENDIEVLKRFYHYVVNNDFDVDNKRKILNTPERSELMAEKTSNILDDFIKVFYIQVKYLIENNKEIEMSMYDYIKCDNNYLIEIKISSLNTYFKKYLEMNYKNDIIELLKKYNRNVFKRYIIDEIGLIRSAQRLHIDYLSCYLNEFENVLRKKNIIYEYDIEASLDDVIF